MVQPAGPMWPGGFETIVHTKDDGEYEVLYLPDLHNDELQAEGKAPVYYWLPNAVRIARKGDIGDYKFHLLHFVGVMSEDTTVGVKGTSEVAGGVLSVTTTAAPPLAVLEASHKQLTEKLRGDTRKYWAWSAPIDPQFAPMPVSDSRTHMSSLSPTLDGSLPSEQPAGGAGPAPAQTPVTPGPASPGAPGPRSVELLRSIRPRLVHSPRTFREGRDNVPGNLDQWYMRIEGQGPGSLNLDGENAYVALCGSLPAAILWQGFHGAYSPVVVSQTLNLKVWSETLRIHITGDWDRVFQHFSSAAQGRSFWFDADIKAEFNNLRISGGIKVEVEIDGTNPGADKMKEEVDKRIDLIVTKFTEEAKARIFDPAPPDVKPAEATSGGGGGLLGGLFGFGGGFALKYRRDETQLHLEYDETRQERFNLTTTVSSSLEGFFNEIKNDADAERKYFTTLYLDDWNRKITHTVKPVVNWPDPSRDWIGDPVAFVSAQIGYPSASGDIQWAAHVFESTATEPTTNWQPAVAKKATTDVASPPSGWTPDTSYVKRSIHFTEPPSETDNPYVRCYVEKNVVDLDPGPNGTATNELNLEIRADSAGKLDVGPISLNVLLDGPAQLVELDLQALGTTDDGTERPITKFTFASADQDKERYWTIFTGQKDFLPRFKYRCRVIVKGGLLTKGMEWVGPWVESAGNGPFVATVPTPDDPGVEKRSLVKSRPATAAAEQPRPAGPAGPPPTSGGAVTPAGRPRTAGRPPAPVTTRRVVAEPARASGRMVGGYELDDPTAGEMGSGATERSATATRSMEGESPASTVTGWTTKKPLTLIG